MKETSIDTPRQVYDYTSLETFFKDVASPQETAAHLGQLLYFLVYYEHKEGIQSFYGIYSAIFSLTQVLQTMTKTGEPWK